jgi:hypothetical protein
VLLLCSAPCPCFSATYASFKLIFCVVNSNGYGILFYIYLRYEVGTLFFCASMCATVCWVDRFSYLCSVGVLSGVYFL